MLCQSLGMSERALPGATIDAGIATAMLSAVGPEPYELVGPLTGGETGATEIRRADGTRFVLKWEVDVDNQQRRKLGAHLAERLRSEASWPSPEQELVDTDGTLLIVQEFMPGNNVDHLSHDLVDRILELHQNRLGLTVVDRPTEWGSYMLKMLVHGGDGYCLHEPLRTFDARTSQLIERIEEIGHSTDPDDLSGSDVIHHDLHPGNLLQVDGQLSAVVDMDYTRIGDAAFDLTMLAISSLGVTADPGVRTRLFEHGVAALSDPKRRVYVSNLVLRNLDWAIRKSRHSEIDFWLTQTKRLLPD